MKAICIVLMLGLLAACQLPDHAFFAYSGNPNYNKAQSTLLLNVANNIIGGANQQDPLALVSGYLASNNSYYTASRSGKVYRFALSSDIGSQSLVNLAKGKMQVQWQRNVGAPITAGVSVHGLHVAVVTSKGELWLLNANNGTVAWTANVGGYVYGPPLLTDSLVVVQTINGSVKAFDLAYGKQVWLTNLPDSNTNNAQIRERTPLTLAPDNSIIAVDRLRMYGLTLSSGMLRWSARTDGYTQLQRTKGTIAASTGLMIAPILIDPSSQIHYSVTLSGAITAYVHVNNAAPGVLWSTPFSSQRAMALGAYLYAVNTQGHLLAFDKQTGTQVWAYQHKAGKRMPQLSNVIAIGDYVVCGDNFGTLVVLNATTGAPLEQFKVGGGVSNLVTYPPNQFMLNTFNGNFSLWRLSR